MNRLLGMEELFDHGILYQERVDSTGYPNLYMIMPCSEWKN